MRSSARAYGTRAGRSGIERDPESAAHRSKLRGHASRAALFAHEPRRHLPRWKGREHFLRRSPRRGAPIDGILASRTRARRGCVRCPDDSCLSDTLRASRGGDRQNDRSLGRRIECLPEDKRDGRSGIAGAMRTAYDAIVRWERAPTGLVNASCYLALQPGH